MPRRLEIVQSGAAQADQHAGDHSRNRWNEKRSHHTIRAFRNIHEPPKAVKAELRREKLNQEIECAENQKAQRIFHRVLLSLSGHEAAEPEILDAEIRFLRSHGFTLDLLRIDKKVAIKFLSGTKVDGLNLHLDQFEDQYKP